MSEGRGGMWSRKRVVAVATLGLVAGLTLLILWTRRPSLPPEPSSTIPPSVQAVLRSVLSSQDSGRREALTTSTQELLADEGAEFVPRDATIKPVEGSWGNSDDVGWLTVQVSAPGEQPRSYRVVLVHQDDEWRISSTQALPVAGSP